MKGLLLIQCCSLTAGKLEDTAAEDRCEIKERMKCVIWFNCTWCFNFSIAAPYQTVSNHFHKGGGEKKTWWQNKLTLSLSSHQCQTNVKWAFDMETSVSILWPPATAIWLIMSYNAIHIKSCESLICAGEPHLSFLSSLGKGGKKDRGFAQKKS